MELCQIFLIYLALGAASYPILCDLDYRVTYRLKSFQPAKVQCWYIAFYVNLFLWPAILPYFIYEFNKDCKLAKAEEDRKKAICKDDRFERYDVPNRLQDLEIAIEKLTAPVKSKKKPYKKKSK